MALISKIVEAARLPVLLHFLLLFHLQWQQWTLFPCIAMAWTHPLTPTILHKQCFLPLHLPSITPPHLCFSNSTHKSLLPLMLSWTSSLWKSPKDDQKPFFSFPKTTQFKSSTSASFGPLPHSTLKITQVGRFFSSASSANTTHDNPSSHGPPCMVRGNLFLSSCQCWSYFGFHGEHVVPPFLSGHHSHDCEATIAVEGIFIQTPHKQMVCMLGCAVRPLPNGSSLSPSSQLHITTQCTFHRGCKDTIEYLQVPVETTTDCEIFVQLIFPTNLTIRSFSIQGTVSSMRKHHDPLYFTPLSLSALYVSTPSRYLHSSGHAECQQADHNRWEAYPLRCEDLRMILDDLHLLMDLEYKGPLFNRNKLGPFTSFVANMTVARAAQIQEFGCEELPQHLRVRFFITAGLAAPSVGGRHSEYLIKSMDELTVATEGPVNRSSGQLCLVACALKPTHLRNANASQENDYDCGNTLSMQINPFISISLRWLVEGTLFSLSVTQDSSSSSSFAPLKLRSYWPSKYDRQNKVPHPITYRYTHIEEIQDRLLTHWSSDGQTGGYKYPTSSGEDLCYADLAHKLNFEIVPGQMSKRSSSATQLRFEVIAVESCVLLEGQTRSNLEEETKMAFTPKHLRMAAEMWLDGYHISVEGLYDVSLGTMLLRGCTAPNAAFHGEVARMDFWSTLDCSLLIDVQFPASNLGWFDKRKWYVNIASTRPLHDMLFFKPLYFEGVSAGMESPVSQSRAQFIKRVEDALHLAILCGIVYCLLSHLAIGTEHAEAMCCTSLFMMGAHGASFLLPSLVYTVNVIQEKSGTTLLLPEEIIGQLIEAFVNISRALACIALLFICHTVRKARAASATATTKRRAMTYNEVEYAVLEMCVPLYLGILVACLAVGAFDTMGSMSMCFSYSFWVLYGTNATRWRRDLIVYGEILQDLFLLPQIVHNTIMNKRSHMPKKYYVGITVLRLTLHCYRLWQHEIILSKHLSLALATESILSVCAFLLALALHLQQILDQDLYHTVKFQ